MRQALGSIEQLRTLWATETGSAGRRAVWAWFGTSLVAAALVGRFGHDWTRALALGIVVLGFVPALLRWMMARRHERDPRAVMSATLLRTQPDLARAALRALTLTDRTSAERIRKANCEFGRSADQDAGA